VDWSILAIILQLVFLEGVLSIDNAAVSGARVSQLPDDRPISVPTRFVCALHIMVSTKKIKPIISRRKMIRRHWWRC
jgi:hypothetical protein